MYSTLIVNFSIASKKCFYKISINGERKYLRERNDLVYFVLLTSLCLLNYSWRTIEDMIIFFLQKICTI